MKELSERTAPVLKPEGIIRLSFDDRQRVRQRTHTISGEEIGIFIERGTSLKGGEHLRSADGAVYRVEALPERVSNVLATGLDLARVAYHLGNRHVKVELGEGWLRYQVDSVLDDMVRRLGFEVTVVEAPFEPEGGAYAHAQGAVAFELGHHHHGPLAGGHGPSQHGYAHGHHHDGHAHDHHHHERADRVNPEPASQQSVLSGGARPSES